MEACDNSQPGREGGGQKFEQVQRTAALFEHRGDRAGKKRVKRVEYGRRKKGPENVRQQGWGFARVGNGKKAVKERMRRGESKKPEGRFVPTVQRI